MSLTSPRSLSKDMRLSERGDARPQTPLTPSKRGKKTEKENENETSPPKRSKEEGFELKELKVILERTPFRARENEETGRRSSRPRRTPRKMLDYNESSPVRYRELTDDDSDNDQEESVATPRRRTFRLKKLDDGVDGDKKGRTTPKRPKSLSRMVVDDDSDNFAEDWKKKGTTTPRRPKSPASKVVDNDSDDFMEECNRKGKTTPRRPKSQSRKVADGDLDEEWNIKKGKTTPRRPKSLSRKVADDDSDDFMEDWNRKGKTTPRRPKSLSRKVVDDDLDEDWNNKKGKTTPRRPKIRTPSRPKTTLVLKVSKQKLASLASSLTGSPMQEAQSRLHVSAVPDSLPCREDKFAEIYAFVESKIEGHCGGCIYISGVPGTGKTATVHEVMRQLERRRDLNFHFVTINGMRMTEPSQAYVQIYRELTGGQKVTAEHARDLLEKRFSSVRHSKSKGSTVLLVDELDKLCTRKQNVLYNLFEWPTLPESRLVVLAVANTMDLPEKMLMGKVSSRLGLTRCQFAPYTHVQLSKIVSCRLSGLKASVFDPDALQLVSRKVASLSGDARRALDLCRRAIEMALAKGKEMVELDDVMSAHEEMFSSPRILAIRSCSFYEQLLLNAIVSCFRSSGVEETNFGEVYDCLQGLLIERSLSKVNTSEAYEMCCGLAALRLILAEPGRMGPRMKLWLNVSQDDVLFALGKRN